MHKLTACATTPSNRMTIIDEGIDDKDTISIRNGIRNDVA